MNILSDFTLRIDNKIKELPPIPNVKPEEIDSMLKTLLDRVEELKKLQQKNLNKDKVVNKQVEKKVSSGKSKNVTVSKTKKVKEIAKAKPVSTKKETISKKKTKTTSPKKK